MMLRDKLTISIATKDRHEVIESTLQHLCAFGLSDCPVIIVDDGSKTKLEPIILERFTNGRLIRKCRVVGQAIARNEIVNQAQTPYVLQLDDDSYPVRGNLKLAIQQLEEAEGCFALALELEEPRRGRSFYSEELGPNLLQVQSFIGCAVLIHRNRFLRVGGYSDWIGRTVEEEELSLRALSMGYQVMFSQAVGIRHEVSDVGRDLPGIQQRSIHNWTAVCIRHVPLILMLWKLFRMLLFSTAQDLKRFQLGALRVYFSGLCDRSNWKARAPMNITVYRRFMRLEHALNYFS